MIESDAGILSDLATLSLILIVGFIAIMTLVCLAHLLMTALEEMD